FGSLEHRRTAYLVKGVVAGIGSYGNCIGVPTVGGELYFDAGYDDNILVNAFTIGIAPADRLFRARAAGAGNPVIYVGARTGRESAVQEVLGRWDLEAAVVGRLTDDGVFRARWRGEEVCALPVAALTDAAPVYRRPAEEPARLEEMQRLDPAEVPEPADYGQALVRLLESPNLCARE